MAAVREQAGASRLRICLVTREYPALGAHGGIGTYTQNLAAGLAARGHDVTVLAHAKQPTPAIREVSASGAIVSIEPVVAPDRWRLPAGNGAFGLSLRSAPFIWAAARKYRQLVKERAFDVVEVPEYQGWGLGVARVATCPVVVRLHTHTALVRRLNDAAINLDARACAWLEAASIRRGDVVLANSQALADIARADFGDALPEGKLGVLPLGIDAARFAPGDSGWLREHLGLAPETPLLLYVGRLERRKGVETLIEAFGKVRERHPDAVLAMAGFSTDTARGGQSLLEVLQARVAAMGAGGHVRFLGHVPYDQLPRYYAGCDLFVAPSVLEPFGMIYLEAMACGRVAVGCRAGGVPEIIEHGRTGYMATPEDPEALGAALSELLRYPSWRARMGEAARREVVARFSLETIGACTEAYYEAAIAARAAGVPAPSSLEAPVYA